MGRFKILLMIILVGMIAVGCVSAKQDSSTSGNSKIKIFTTVYPIQYAVERIGEDAIMAKSVFPSGADAHTYQPASKEMAAIAESDAFVYMGESMEGFSESMANALSDQDVKLIEIGKHEELFLVDGEQHSDDEEQGSHSHEHEGEDHEDEENKHGDEDAEHGEADHTGDSHDDLHHGDKDPHIWLDPMRMIKVAEIIKKNLIDLQPENKEVFTQNYQELKKDLLALDKQFTETLKDNEHLEMLVSHAAYGYWEARYGIEQIATSGLSSSEEPSQKELTNIVDTARKHKLEYVIFEQNITDKVSKIIQEHINAEALYIHNLSVLTDEDIKQNEDYISIMKKNLQVLEKATK
ncbi:metal ABC transporter solute-binding protein, Zn/Mn family [Virgibacillus kekensis]|uniref:Metal ABC transporter solute-binding protein, Zn/Mn family n=1 Tax=Virgibacillus kekensis TaxID=202261 RepID=A0ABV9DPL9_9BACI